MNANPDMNPPAGETPRPPRRLWLHGVMAIYALFLLLVWLINATGPENFWPAVLNLYLPQWLWLLPGLPLVFAYALWARKRVWLPVFTLAFVVFVLMGWRWHFGGGASSDPKAVSLRVLTYNVKWAHRDARAVMDEFDRDKPDVILMQDAGGVLNGPLGQYFAGWNVRAEDQYVIASHLPLSPAEVRWMTEPEHFHRCLRCVVTVKGTDIVLYTAHLKSPRFGLRAIRHQRNAEGADSLQENAEERLDEARLLAGHIKGETGPVVLTGDLNAPVQSLVCRHLFDAGLRDAFDQAGRGYGYSYGQYTKLRMPYVRIDHVMVSKEWDVVSCQAGNAIGSDHSPIIADLILKP